jgi:hypothetical protein
VTHSERENDVFNERGFVSGGATFPQDSVATFQGVQSQAMLHELFHLQYSSDTVLRPAVGISSPRCIDRSVSGLQGKAYGPARAKYLARAQIAGPQAALSNVDNHVFFLICKWMYKTFGVAASGPKFAWATAPMGKREDDDNPADFDDFDSWDDDSDNDTPEAMPNFEVNEDDDDFYGGTASTATPAWDMTCMSSVATDGPTTDVTYATEQINTYCTYLEQNSVSMSCQTPYAPIGYAASESNSDDTMWLTIQWDEDTCQGLGPFNIEVDDCKEKMLTLLNGCDTDTTTAKYGGALEQNCLLYQLALLKGNSDIPPEGIEAENSNCKAPL